jgi:GGDEF domain-containing protein
VEQGLEQVEREVARASRYGRKLSLSLIVIDGPPSGADGRQDRGMSALTQLVLRELTRFDIVVRYGPAELLIVLPELAAEPARTGASLLSEMASRRLGRQVRAASVSVPDGGVTTLDLLAELENVLHNQRAAMVQPGQPEPRAEPRRRRFHLLG